MRDLRELVRRDDTLELIRHELSTPVATALLYIGIAESYAARLPVDVVTPALKVVRSEVQRLKALIDTLTELQRSSRPAIRPRFMNIAAIVRVTVRRLLTTFAGTEGVTIAEPRNALHGWWDPTVVEQIVTNLLGNALKFGMGRSVRLAVRAVSAGVTISVRDQGVGIAAADRVRIFERHAHAPAAEGGGLGLGLWLVRELVQAHGGRIRLRSRRGRGTTFTVLLPTRPPVLGSAQAAAVRMPAQRSPLRSIARGRATTQPIPAHWQERLARSPPKLPLPVKTSRHFASGTTAGKRTSAPVG